MNPKTIQTTKNGLVFFLYINIQIYTYKYMHMYIHNTDRLWSEGVTDIKFRGDKLVETVFPIQLISPGPELQRVSYMKNWMVKTEHLTPAQLNVISCALFFSSKITPFLWREMAGWRKGLLKGHMQHKKPVLAGVCPQGLLLCLVSCWAPELKFVWWITETTVCANPARVLHFHNHMQLWGWLNSFTQIQFALRH